MICIIQHNQLDTISRNTKLTLNWMAERAEKLGHLLNTFSLAQSSTGAKGALFLHDDREA